MFGKITLVLTAATGSLLAVGLHAPMGPAAALQPVVDRPPTSIQLGSHRPRRSVGGAAGAHVGNGHSAGTPAGRSSLPVQRPSTPSSSPGHWSRAGGWVVVGAAGGRRVAECVAETAGPTRLPIAQSSTLRLSVPTSPQPRRPDRFEKRDILS